MEWIFDHFQLVLGIVIIVAYLLRGVIGNRVSGGDPDTGTMEEPAEVDTDEAERTRRVQEEIRRRILARQRGEEPAQPSRPATVRLDPVPQRRQTPPPIRQTTAMLVDPLADAASQAILDRQRELEEKMKHLRHLREAGSGNLPKAPSRSWTQESDRRQSAMVATRKLRGDLHRPDSLRRAIVLREVLGQPLGFEMGPPNLPRR